MVFSSADGICRMDVFGDVFGDIVSANITVFKALGPSALGHASPLCKVSVQSQSSRTCMAGSRVLVLPDRARHHTLLRNDWAQSPYIVLGAQQSHRGLSNWMHAHTRISRVTSLATGSISRSHRFSKICERRWNYARSFNTFGSMFPHGLSAPGVQLVHARGNPTLWCGSRHFTSGHYR
jgi:hypothetical protein